MTKTKKGEKGVRIENKGNGKENKQHSNSETIK